MCSEHQDEITLDLMIASFDDNGWQKFEKKYIKNERTNSKG